MDKQRSSLVVEPGRQCFLVIKAYPDAANSQKHHSLLHIFTAKIRKSFRRKKKPSENLPFNYELEVALDVPYPSDHHLVCARSHVVLQDAVVSLQILAAHAVLSSYQKAKKSDLTKWKVSGEYVMPKGKSKKDGSAQLSLTIPLRYVRKGIIPPKILEAMDSERPPTNIDSGIGLDDMGRKSHDTLFRNAVSKSNNPYIKSEYGDFNSTRFIVRDDHHNPRYSEIGTRPYPVKPGIRTDGDGCLQKTKSEMFFAEDLKCLSESTEDRYMSIVLPEGSSVASEDPYSRIDECNECRNAVARSPQPASPLQKIDILLGDANILLSRYRTNPNTEYSESVDRSNRRISPDNPDCHTDNPREPSVSKEDFTLRRKQEKDALADASGDENEDADADAEQGLGDHEHPEESLEDSESGRLQKTDAYATTNSEKDLEDHEYLEESQEDFESGRLQKTDAPTDTNSENDLKDREDTEESQDDSQLVISSDIYVSSRELAGVVSTQVQQIMDDRKFVRLVVNDKEGMFHSDLLHLSLFYEPATFVAPPLDEIIIGISENSADQPSLLLGQRMMSPVLVCMPHQASFHRPLSVTCELLNTPDPASTIKVLHSSTDVTEDTVWQEATDVMVTVHDDKLTLLLNHFCLYCVIEEAYTVAPQQRHRIVSLFLRAKQLADGECVEVSVRVSETADNPTPPALGGKLIHQKPLTLINRRPVTLTLTSNNTLWQLRGENKQQQAVHDPEMALTVCREFNLYARRSLSTNRDTLDFEVRLKQCEGLCCDMHVCESMTELFRESPVSRPTNLGRSHQLLCQPQHCSSCTVGPQEQPVVATAFRAVPSYSDPHLAAPVVPQGRRQFPQVPMEGGEGIGARPKVPTQLPRTNAKTHSQSRQPSRKVPDTAQCHHRSCSPNLPSSFSGPMAGTFEPQDDRVAAEQRFTQQGPGSVQQVPYQQMHDLRLSENNYEQQVPEKEDASGQPSYQLHHPAPGQQNHSLPHASSSVAAQDRHSSTAPDGPSIVAPDGPSVAAPDVPSVAAPDVPSVAAPDGPSVVAPNGLSVAASDGPSATVPVPAHKRASLAATPDGSSVTSTAPGYIPTRRASEPMLRQIGVLRSMPSSQGDQPTDNQNNQNHLPGASIVQVPDSTVKEPADQEFQQKGEQHPDALAIPNTASQPQQAIPNQLQVINNQVIHNHFYRDSGTYLPPSVAKEWPVPYKVCEMVGLELDARNGWKKLASKLDVDRYILSVEQMVTNQGSSPTEMLLRQWMNDQAPETCMPQLIQALRNMGRNDIADDVEENE